LRRSFVAPRTRSAASIPSHHRRRCRDNRDPFPRAGSNPAEARGLSRSPESKSAHRIDLVGRALRASTVPVSFGTSMRKSESRFHTTPRGSIGTAHPSPAAALSRVDLVFFDRLRHSGIYIGGGRFIHARQTGKHVSIASLDDGWYAEHWVGARRL